MLTIVLHQPEIPPNTGNIMRLCVNTGAKLHLIKPLGFDLSDKALKRARLDYLLNFSPTVHENFEQYALEQNMDHIYLFSTKGERNFADVTYQANDHLLFGSETRGLPDSILERFRKDQILRIPMLSESRSLNLSNAVAVAVYEAWRQLQFAQAHF